MNILIILNSFTFILIIYKAKKYHRHRPTYDVHSGRGGRGGVMRSLQESPPEAFGCGGCSLLKQGRGFLAQAARGHREHLERRVTRHQVHRRHRRVGPLEWHLSLVSSDDVCLKG